MERIRSIVESDLPELKNILDTIDLFPSDMIGDMTSDYFNNPETEDYWFTMTDNETPVALGFCSKEKLTVSCFNLYALGVRADIQGKGIGRKMMEHIEQRLKEQGHKILIVETSGTAAYESTRIFYEKLAYTKEAVIRDFWDEGDDKVIYWKKLN